MTKTLGLLFAVVLTCGVVAAQNSNSSTTTERPRSTTNTNTNRPKAPATPQPTPGSDGVLAAFNSLLDGIRHANVNYNGSVTKGWEQVKKNRESSYPEIKDVKLDVKDVSVTMLGRDGAIVTCLWTQSQEYKGTPETASGRMTLVFKRVGTAWKAIHLHSSTDTPNPAVIPPSERPTASPSPTP